MIYLIILFSNILFAAEGNLFKEINTNIAQLNKNMIETDFVSYIPEMQSCSENIDNAVQHFYKRNNIRDAITHHKLLDAALTLHNLQADPFLLGYFMLEHEEFIDMIGCNGKKEWLNLQQTEKTVFNQNTSPLLDTLTQKYSAHLKEKLKEENPQGNLGHVHKLATCAYIVNLAKPENN